MAAPKLKSPHSARPGSLSAPVPTPDMQENTDADAEIAAALAGMEAPSAGDAAAALPPGQPQDAPTPPMPVNGEFASEPSPEGFTVLPDTSGAVSFGDPSEFGIRAKASFAMTDKEKHQVLAERYGAQNVKLKGDEFYVKRPGDNGFTKFDPAGFDIMGDLADFARPAVEEVAKLPFEIAGGMYGMAKGAVAGMGIGTSMVPGFGTVAGGVAGGGVGGTMGVFAGRAVGAGFGTWAADKMAEYIGIAQDPARNKLAEAAIASISTATLGMLGDRYAASMARKTLAKQLAVPQTDLITAESKDILFTAKELRDMGKWSVGPGGQLALLPHQVAPDSDLAKQFFKDTSHLTAAQKIRKQQSEQIDGVIKDTIVTALGLTGERSPEDFVDGMYVTPQLSNTIKRLTIKMNKAEGAAIGAFRDKADVALARKARALPTDALTTLHDLTFSMGLSPKDLSKLELSPQVIGNIQTKLQIESPEIARTIGQKLQNISKRMTRKGGMTFEDLRDSVSDLSLGYDAVDRAGNEASALYSKLSSEMRAHMKELVKSTLPASEAEAFEQSMQRFEAIKTARKSLGAFLRDNISNKAYISGIFSEGSRGLEKLQAVKMLLQKEEPGAWDALKQEYMEQLFTRNTDVSTTSLQKLNAAGLKKHFTEMPAETRNILFEDPKNYGSLMGVISLGQRIKETDLATVPNEQNANMIKAFFNLAYKSTVLNAKGLLVLAGAMESPESKFMKALSDEGVENILKGSSPGVISWAKSRVSEMQDLYRESIIRGASPLAITSWDDVKNPKNWGLARRATRSTLVEDMKTSFTEKPKRRTER